jgi:DnaK suppressor protein
MSDQHPTPDVGAALHAERAHLEVQLGELATGADAELEYDENFADSAQVAAEKGENRSLADSLREQLSDVDQALDRLDKGTYGVCTNCGEAIDPERLGAMPATPRCISCV